MTPEHLQASIIRARASGFTSFAAALETEYQRRHSRIQPHAFKWSLVTGTDFGRAVKWAKQRGNLVSRQISEALK